MGQEESTIIGDDVPPVLLEERSLAAVADYIKSGKVKRIVAMVGAGISTAAGSEHHPYSLESEHKANLVIQYPTFVQPRLASTAILPD